MPGSHQTRRQTLDGADRMAAADRRALLAARGRETPHELARERLRLHDVVDDELGREPDDVDVGVVLGPQPGRLGRPLVLRQLRQLGGDRKSVV